MDWRMLNCTLYFQNKLSTLSKFGFKSFISVWEAPSVFILNFDLLFTVLFFSVIYWNFSWILPAFNFLKKKVVLLFSLLSLSDSSHFRWSLCRWTICMCMLEIQLSSDQNFSFCVCGGLTFSGCKTPAHLLSHCSFSKGLKGENKMKKLLDWDKDR